MSKYKSSENLSEFNAREEIYEKNRNAICEEIRKSGKVINRVVRGFFSHPDHLSRHFSYLSSGVDDLKERISRNWHNQVNFMEAYIRKTDKKKSFIAKLTEVEKKGCNRFLWL